MKRAYVFYAIAAVVSLVWAYVWIVCTYRHETPSVYFNSVMTTLLAALVNRGRADKYFNGDENDPPPDHPSNPRQPPDSKRD